MLQLDARRAFVADRLRLGRALAHLVQNAVTVAPRGSVVTVTTSDDDERGTVRFTVEDHGAGHRARSAPRPLPRFDVREAPGRSRVGGLGLGLAFVRMVAEAHGGVVGVKSAPGYTTIGFEVPA